MAFFTYYQNNSGGDLIYDFEKGISVYVIVEADTAAEANARAERIGLYFDGEGDCPCCGDRWDEAYDQEADSEPCIYGSPVAEFQPWHNWMGENPGCFIHYKDRVSAVHFKEMED